MSSTAKVTDVQIDRFAVQYKERRKLQMFRFFGATVFTLVSARLAFRGVSARKCMFILEILGKSCQYIVV